MSAFSDLFSRTAGHIMAGFGKPIVPIPHAPTGAVFYTGGTVFVSTLPYDDITHAGILARWTVRDAFRDVLNRAGETVSDHPPAINPGQELLEKWRQMGRNVVPQDDQDDSEEN